MESLHVLMIYLLIQEVVISKHGYGRALVDGFIIIEQRFGNCSKCDSIYTGPKKKVICPNCKNEITTSDVKCVKRVPTGIFTVSSQKKKGPNE